MSALDTGPARPPGYPLVLDLAGRAALLVGGGRVAARKAGALLAAGARVRVVAPALGDELRTRHEAGELAWQARAASPDDVDGVALVICASTDREGNAAVAARARSAGIPVVVADDPATGTAWVPASIRRGPLTIAVSTAGTSPALAAFVRRGLETDIGPEFAELAELAALMRARGRAAGIDAAARERAASETLPQLLELLRDGRRDEATTLAERAAVQTEVAGWS